MEGGHHDVQLLLPQVHACSRACGVALYAQLLKQETRKEGTVVFNAVPCVHTCSTCGATRTTQLQVQTQPLQGQYTCPTANAGS